MFDLPKNLLQDPFSQDKQHDLLPLFLQITKDHCKACPAYNKIVKAAFPHFKEAKNLKDIPYLPVSLFKQRELRSINHEDVRLKIQSSGTTGSQKSQIALDKENAQLSSQALSIILRSLVGEKRKPMLYIDTESVLTQKGEMGARAAAILGLMPFGHNHIFALDNTLSPIESKIKDFLEKHEGKDVIIYGFTSLIWEAFIPYCKKHKPDLSKATLLHSGGWKHLHKQNIDNATFRTSLKESTKISKIINFYGMAEMPGIIFPENEQDSLSIPNFSSILIRDPIDFSVLPHGEKGLVQTFNPLARSYPGHSLLTEDIGVLDETGLRLLGRAPKAELRGCSDVLVA